MPRTRLHRAGRHRGSRSRSRGPPCVRTSLWSLLWVAFHPRVLSYLTAAFRVRIGPDGLDHVSRLGPYIPLTSGRPCISLSYRLRPPPTRRSAASLMSRAPFHRHSPPSATR